MKANETLLDEDPKSGIKLFNDYLLKHQKDAKESKINDLYYHADVVAEAYSKGYEDGENSSEKILIEKLVKSSLEKFLEQANQVYLCSKSVINHLKSKNYDVSAFYINVFHRQPKVIFSVKNDFLLNDDFVEFSYSKIFETACMFEALTKKTLDMGFIGNATIDKDLLIQDGFQYSEVL